MAPPVLQARRRGAARCLRRPGGCRPRLARSGPRPASAPCSPSPCPAERGGDPRRARAPRGRAQRLEQLARLDPLTGLPNRRARGSTRLRGPPPQSHARRFALLMLDLNDFKAINERVGHAGGDELLRDVGRALRTAVREQDTVARLSTDEFCVLSRPTATTRPASPRDCVRRSPAPPAASRT
ncbi:MAG TPA: GGDEF domain-containing protein [Thermoleophilaceae bacterium]|nr:GGDEF domain-containing protein [Thermoleophilaceae bacterium]